MTSRVPRHPNPPKSLYDQELPLIEQKGPWMRIHQKQYGCIHFGRRASGRFDDPQRVYGVLYLGEDYHGAFIETLGWQTGKKDITLRALQERMLSQVTSTHPLRLVDLTGPGLSKIGADADLCTGRSRTLPQKWSRAIWSHPSKPDGIRSISRHDPRRFCCVVFDQVEPLLLVKNLATLEAQSVARQTGQIMDSYGFSLLG